VVCLYDLRIKYAEARLCSLEHLSKPMNETPMSTPAIEVPLTAGELAPLIHLQPVTILRWAREGRIPHRRLSARKILFLPSEINKWLASQSSTS
jgi:predicted DNA-binding transcriptional regulator AlpA